MGKLIQFPVSRVRRHPHRQAAAELFGAFGELQLVERAQLKLLAVCCAATLMLATALQLSAQ